MPAGHAASRERLNDFAIVFFREQSHHLVNGRTGKFVQTGYLRGYEMQQVYETFGRLGPAVHIDAVLGNEEAVSGTVLEEGVPAVHVGLWNGAFQNGFPVNGADSAVYRYETVELLAFKVVYGAVRPPAANEQPDALLLEQFERPMG